MQCNNQPGCHRLGWSQLGRSEFVGAASRMHSRVLCLSPVHTSNSDQNIETLPNATSLTILSTMLTVTSTLLPFLVTMLPLSATMSNEISSFRQSRNKLNMVNLFRLCRKNEILRYSFDVVAVCGNKVERCFDKVERSFDNVACCFDIVASVDWALQCTILT